MKLYYHPISSYSQKTVMAFHEKNLKFTPEIVDIMSPAGRGEYRKINSLGKVPTLVLDDGWRIPESSIIIEYIDGHFPESGTRLIPGDRDRGRQTRFFDRLADLYLNEMMTTVFFDGRKPPEARNPAAVKHAQETLDTMLGNLDTHLGKHTPWVMDHDFTMADCSLAPTLGYMRMVHPFDAHKNVAAYFQRVAERPSFKRIMDEAAPYLAAMSSK
jgi:glutathione S-transferase